MSACDNEAAGRVCRRQTPRPTRPTRPVFAILLSALLSFGATPAFGQPTNLIPGASGPAGTDAQRPAASPPPAPSVPSRTPERPTGPARIEIGELDSPQQAPIGALNLRDGAFSADIWHRSRKVDLEPLFARLTTPTRSGALQDLRRRLLLTPAAPPQDMPAEQFLVWRLAALLDAGQAADAAALAAAAPPTDLQRATLQRLTADAAWLDGATEQACDVTRTAILDHPDPYWEKSNLLCQAARGDVAMAALTAGSIAETGTAPDAFIRAARAALNGSTVIGDPALVADPLSVALFDLTGGTPPDGFATGADSAALAAVARLPGAPLAMRIKAAEQAVGEGSLQPAVLAAIWLQAAQEDSPAADAPARSFRTLEAQVTDPGRAQAQEDSVEAVLVAGRSAGIADAMARTATPLLSRLTPEQLGSRLAADTIRTFLRAGDVEEALSWWQRLRAARADPEARRTEAEIWAVLRIAAPPGFLPWSEADHADWIATLDLLPFSRQQEREAGYLALADALDLPLGAAQRAAVPLQPALDATGPAALSPGVAARPAQRQRETLGRFDAAVADRRQGEAMLAALALLLPRGPGETDMALVSRVVKGLKQLGLDRAARRIAAEKALAAGL